MAQFETWLLKGFLGLMWVVPIWMAYLTPQLCSSLEALKDQLNSSLRRRYLKHNFPINYTMRVQYEEVFRLKNISKLMNDSADMEDLQDLWVKITERNIKNILNVLPKRHPTRHKYLTSFDKLFTAVQESYPIQDGKEYPDRITDLMDTLDEQDNKEWKSVTPKSLMDNCYRTMHCLFKECFSSNGSEYDYCNSHHWRRLKGTQG